MVIAHTCPHIIGGMTAGGRYFRQRGESRKANETSFMEGSVYKKTYDFQRYNSYYFAEKLFSITFAAFSPSLRPGWERMAP